MRISRVRPIVSAENMIEENNKYASAIGHIRSAIDALGEIAKDDELAKESIANLSVILLDLNSADTSESQLEAE